MFSKLQSLNAFKADPDEFRKAKLDAISHLKFCIELYQIQLDGGSGVAVAA